jgi:predicted TIM-barrel fold metal-dependent hydrolase
VSNYIDAHVHVWTPDRKFPRVPGEQNYPPVSFTPEELFAHSKPCGVNRIVLIQMSFYGTDNTYMLKAIRDHAGVFSGVGIVDAEAPDVVAKMRELKRHGVRGFRIQPGKSPQTWLDTPGMERMWKCGAEEGLAMCPLLNPDALPAVGRMCAKHPDTPVVIDHLARIGASGKIVDADVQALTSLASHQRVHVKVSAFYALGAKKEPYHDLAPLIRRVYEAFGARRLMWASDCPFQVQGNHSYRASIDLVREGLPFLKKEDREWILTKTAERVFF